MSNEPIQFVFVINITPSLVVPAIAGCLLAACLSSLWRFLPAELALIIRLLLFAGALHAFNRYDQRCSVKKSVPSHESQHDDDGVLIDIEQPELLIFEQPGDVKDKGSGGDIMDLPISDELDAFDVLEFKRPVDGQPAQIDTLDDLDLDGWEFDLEQRANEEEEEYQESWYEQEEHEWYEQGHNPRIVPIDWSHADQETTYGPSDLEWALVKYDPTVARRQQREQERAKNIDKHVL